MNNCSLGEKKSVSVAVCEQRVRSVGGRIRIYAQVDQIDVGEGLFL